MWFQQKTWTRIKTDKKKNNLKQVLRTWDCKNSMEDITRMDFWKNNQKTDLFINYINIV